jgi:hypothetical protein
MSDDAEAAHSVEKFLLCGSRAEFGYPPRLEVCDRGKDDRRVGVVPVGRPSRVRAIGRAFRSDVPEVLFARTSGPVTLVVFDGEHDVAYHPGLEWAHRVAALG